MKRLVDAWRSLPPRARRILLDTLGGLGPLSYFALWACAPPVPGSFRPMTPMSPPPIAQPQVPNLPPEEPSAKPSTLDNEFGVSGSFIGVVRKTTPTSVNPQLSPGGMGQIYYFHRFGRRFDFGAIAFGGGGGGGVFGGAGGGLMLRGIAVDRENVAFGVELAGGWPWVELNLPLGVHLGDVAWLYTSPGGLFYEGSWGMNIPVGLSLQFHPKAALLIEGGATPIFTNFQTINFSNTSTSGSRAALVHGGLGGAFRW
jgi:hypothetical protein